MDSQDFFIVLPSNTHTDIFPSNTVSTFQIPLPQALEFPDTWEVALVELFYPHTWSNVSVENSAFDTYTLHNMERRKFKIDDGFYLSAGQIVLALNEQIRHRTERTKFKFNKFNGRVTLYVGSGEAIQLKSRLARMLGFEQNYFANPDDDTVKFKADMVADIHTSLRFFYIYCDIIKPVLVGNGYFPLLRVVNSRGERDETISENFLAPYYHEIAFDRINSIKITLRDDLGEPINFESGKVIAKLHFRRKRTYLL